MAATNSSSPPAEAGGKSVFLLGRSLGIGGAERQMVQLAIGLQARGYKVTVALFYCGGALDRDLIDRRIRIVDLAKRSRWDVAGFLVRLIRTIRRARPDIVYSFLGTANTVAALVRPFAPGFRLLWSVRASNMDLGHYDRAARLGYRIECGLSGSPDLTISNSRAGLEYAAAHGFRRERMVVIPNGIDTDRFRPDDALRREARARWGLRDDQLAIGVLARLDPMKDHSTFLRAAAIAAEARPDLRFLCIGEGPGDYRRRLEALAESVGIADRVIWPGAAIDPVPALNGLDVACSSSSEGEGFSNAVAEAMACGRPCVVTDVGDSAFLVGETGLAVPPGDPRALAAALIDALGFGPEAGRRARARIVSEFSVERMVERTIACF